MGEETQKLLVAMATLQPRTGSVARLRLWSLFGFLLLTLVTVCVGLFQIRHWCFSSHLLVVHRLVRSWSCECNGFTLFTTTMGRKKIQISRITDERNRQVSNLRRWGIGDRQSQSRFSEHLAFCRWRSTSASSASWRRHTNLASCVTAKSHSSSSAAQISCTSTPAQIWTKFC